MPPVPIHMLSKLLILLRYLNLFLNQGTRKFIAISISVHSVNVSIGPSQTFSILLKKDKKDKIFIQFYLLNSWNKLDVLSNLYCTEGSTKGSVSSFTLENFSICVSSFCNDIYISSVLHFSPIFSYFSHLQC